MSFHFTPFSTGIRSISVALTFTPFGLPAQTLTLTGTGVNAGAQPAVITQGFICGGGVCTLGGQLAGNTAGNFFATQLSATGGTAPYTWSEQAPAGLTIQPDGIIVGAPTHTGTTTSLLTQVSGVNLPDGTQLWVTYDNVPVGMITLNGGSGSMTSYVRPNTAYGFDQVRIFTSFPQHRRAADPARHPVRRLTAAADQRTEEGRTPGKTSRSLW